MANIFKVFSTGAKLLFHELDSLIAVVRLMNSSVDKLSLFSVTIHITIKKRKYNVTIFADITTTPEGHLSKDYSFSFLEIVTLLAEMITAKKYEEIVSFQGDEQLTDYYNVHVRLESIQ